jgi:hypothetical protein
MDKGNMLPEQLSAPLSASPLELNEPRISCCPEEQNFNFKARVRDK